jgi:hypothetical protein
MDPTQGAANLPAAEQLQHSTMVDSTEGELPPSLPALSLNRFRFARVISSGGQGHALAMEKKCGLEATGDSGDGRLENKWLRPPALAR